jgi:ADP-heptose:LPS heptosyltransferase
MTNSNSNPTSANRLAVTILDQLQTNQSINYSLLTQLLEICGSSDISLAQDGISALFKGIIEPLNDSFRLPDQQAYYLVFSEIIQQIRSNPKAKQLHQELQQEGIFSAEDAFNRTMQQLSVPAKISNPAAVKKVFILSRVTLGADIAITSILIQKVKQYFTEATCIVIGDEKLKQLFSFSDRLQLLPIRYPRQGDLISRFNSWLDARTLIIPIISTLLPHQWLIIDPKSRITQLGLLPLASPKENTFILDHIAMAGNNSNLGLETNHWFDKTFGIHTASLHFPCIDIADSSRKSFFMRYSSLLSCKRQRVTINFGSGGNRAKELPIDLEVSILKKLINEGFQVWLDKGYGTAEYAKIDHLVSLMDLPKQTFLDASDTNPAIPPVNSPDLIVFTATAAELSVLIAKSDLYVGYDSMGQHMAAAVKTPAIILFNGHPNPVFLTKWTPLCRTPLAVIDCQRVPENKIIENFNLSLLRLMKSLN